MRSIRPHGSSSGARWSPSFTSTAHGWWWRSTRIFSALCRVTSDSRGRRPDARMSRLYAAECMPTLTGAAADERRPTRSSDIEALAGQIELALSSQGRPSERWLAGVVADITAHRGESLVVAGEGQPAVVHAIAYRINQQLGNFGRTVDFIAPPIDADAGSLGDLVRAMHAGQVDTLLILD